MQKFYSCENSILVQVYHTMLTDFYAYTNYSIPNGFILLVSGG